MADSKFYPGVSGDDYYWGGESTFDSSSDNIVLGKISTTSYYCGVRFPNVTIPQGAVILSAHVTFHAHDTQSGILYAYIAGNDVDNAVAPTTKEGASGLALTDETVPWEPVAMTAGQEYDTPDISDIIKEIVDRPGWASGNAMQILFRLDSADGNRKFRSRDHVNQATEKPELHIEYFSGSSLDYDAAPMTMTLTIEGELQAGAGLNKNLPGLICEGELAVRSGILNRTLPGLQIEASGGLGTFATLDKSLPGHLIEARSGHFSDIALAGLLCQGSGLTGQVGRLTRDLPGFIITASGKAAQVGLLDRDLPGFLIEAHGYSEVLGRLDKTLPGLRIEATGLVGSSGRADLILPGFTIAASAIHENRLTADLVLPGFFIDAEGHSIPGFLTCVVMNPKNLAISEYRNFNFNSFAFFNGKYLAAGPNGIHVLEGDTDNGDPILSLIKTGHISTGSARARDIYLMGRSEAQMRVRLIGDEEEESREEADYLISKLGQDRIVTPRGLDPVYLQIAIENSQGGDFDLDSIQVFGEALKRRKR